MLCDIIIGKRRTLPYRVIRVNDKGKGWSIWGEIPYL